MKNILTIVSLIFVFVFHAQSQATFQKTYGSSNGNDEANCVIKTFDGNCVFAGYTSFQNPAGAIYLVKINNVGDTIWSKIIGDTIQFRNSLFVEQVRDSGLIISGYNTIPNGVDDIYLIRTNQTGDIIWTRKYGYSNEDEIYSIHETFDGNFIAAGYSYQGGAYCCGKGLLMKLNSNGDSIWTKTFMSVVYDWFEDIKETSDSNYIIVGNTDDTTYSGRTYVSLMKVNRNGNLIWSKAFNILNIPRINSIELATDGFILCGQSFDDPFSFNHFIFLLKTDLQGNPLWCKTFTTPFYPIGGVNLSKSLNGGFNIVGNSIDLADTLEKILLIRTDSLGDTLWTNSFTAKPASEGRYGTGTSDGGCILVGFTADTLSFDPIEKFYINIDIYVIKTDSLGHSGCNEKAPSLTVGTFLVQEENVPLIISSNLYQSSLGASVSSGGAITNFCFYNGINEISSSNTSFELFPNPSSGMFTIQFNEPIQNASLKIFNILGKEIYGDSILLTHSLEKEIQLNLSPGIYILQFNTKKTQYSKKLIIE